MQKKKQEFDHLFMIVMEVAKAGRNQHLAIQDFEDFASNFSLSEVCSMIVQILSDRKATYNVSSRVMDLF